MVIQRWQTVFLFLASILTIVFCFIPVGDLTDAGGIEYTVLVCNHIPYLILNLASAALLFIAIFLFRNTRRQRLVTLIAMFLIEVSLAIGIYFIFISLSDSPKGDFGIACLLLPAALIAAFIAYRRILADEKLLKSYDRLR